jgi:uncharacterized phiE125 gp8 family phage protein
VIDLGDAVTLTYPSKPASPASVVLTIGQPDGTTAGPFAALSGTWTFTPAQVGRHTVLWVSSGPADAYSDTFDVAAAEAGGIISLADAKAHLRFPADYDVDDEELRLFIASTTALIEHEVGPVLPADHTEIVQAVDTIVLSKAPVLRVSSIATTFPLADYAFSASQYVLDGPSGILRRIPFIGGPLDWSTNWTPGLYPMAIQLTVTYTAGRPTVPAALQAAARIIVENLWESRRIAGSQSPGGDEVQQFGREVIPARAIELMAPYRRAPRIV